MTSVTEVRLLTIKEVATILRVSEPTAYRLREEGEFDSIPVGRQWRVTESALEAYMTPKSRSVHA